MKKLPNKIENAIESNTLIPFIGSGFSTQAGLPSWGSVIDHLVDVVLDHDPDIYRSFGDFLQIAEVLEKAKGMSFLRGEIQEKFRTDQIDISNSRVHELLVEWAPSKIYTTNWDDLIEKSFKHYNKEYCQVAEFADLHNNATKGPTTIVKFHGDLKRGDDSIVFTETSYFERMEFNSPLDITLRSDLLSNTFLFIGYSMSDFNVRFMWFKLQQLLKNQQLIRKYKEYFAYIVLYKPNPVFKKICQETRNIGVIELDPFQPEQSLIKLFEKIVKKNKS